MRIEIEDIVIPDILIKDCEETSIYDVEINGCSINFGNKTKVEFDSDGDCIVKLDVDETILVEYISTDVIIEHLEYLGYTVTKED